MLKERFVSLVLAAFFGIFIAACGSEPEQKSCTSLGDCEQGQRCDESGVCSSKVKSCETTPECAADEYCAEHICQPASCSEDASCADGNVCVFDTCREGCRPGDSSCGDGEVCNANTFLCEPEGCTPTSCRARLQRCDDTQSPAACVFTGACDTDYHCLAYGKQQGDDKDYICNVARGECVEKPPCTGDDDCKIGEICDENAQGELSCRAGCRVGQDCRIGELCAVDQGSVCVKGCSNDDQCQVDGDPRAFYCRNLQCVPTCASVDDCNVEGQVCVGSPSFCQGCTDDTQCRSTQFCDFEMGATPEEEGHPNIGLCRDAPPTCPDDGFGENVDRSSAYVVDAFPFEVSGEEAAYLCREHAGGDWFAIDVGAGQYIEIDLEYDQQDGNLDVSLVRADGSEIVASAYPPDVDGGKERIRYGVDLGARLYIQVRGAILSSNVRYALRVNVGDAPACTEDVLDPNTRDEPADLQASTVYSDLRVCGTGPDYYKISVSDNQVVRITAQAPVNLGYIKLALFSMDGDLITTSDSRRGAETLYHSTTLAEDFIVRVTIVNDVGDVGYTIEWTTSENQCSDVFEPNDSCDTAAKLEAGIFESLNICIDADYYKITLLPFQRVTVAATYDPSDAAGELDISLFGPNDCLSLVVSGDEGPGPSGTTVSDTLTYQSARGGDYYLLANLFQGLHVPYTLDVQIEEGPACEDDAFEGNVSIDQAKALSRDSVLDQTQSAILGLKMCDSKADWYSLELQEGDVLKWEVRYNSLEGDIETTLVGPDQVTELTNGIEDTDEAGVVTLEHTVGVSEAGTYYLKTAGAYPVRMEYRLLTYLNGVGPELPACPDRMGDNATRDTAKELGEGRFEDLVVCGKPSYEKWFKVPVSAGETLDVKVAYNPAGGRVNLRLHNEDGSVIKSLTGIDGVQQYAFESTLAQDIFIEVHVPRSVVWTTYSMEIVKTGAIVCEDDRFAGNHTQDDAASVEAPGIYTRMRMCDEDNDFYKVDLVENQKFEAFIRFVHANADLDLYLWGPDEQEADPLNSDWVVVGSSTDSANNKNEESIIFTPKYTVPHYVEVRPATPARANYDLLLFLDVNGDGTLEGTPDRVCPDQFEDNDSRDEARRVGPGSYENLSVCRMGAQKDDWDFYEIYVPADATLTVDLEFEHADGNIDMALYRSDSYTAEVTSDSLTNFETVSVTNDSDGAVYVLQVYGTGMGIGARNYYSMDIELVYADVCDNPAIAGSDLGSAKVLGASAHENLQLCEGTEHWYKLSLDAGDALLANMDINRHFVEIDMELLDGSGNVVVSDLQSVNLKQIDYSAGTSDTYYLRVFARDGISVRSSYDLWLALDGVKPDRPYCPDDYERNDSSEMAAPLVLVDSKQSQYTDMIACGVEEDWYRVSDLGINTGYELAVFTEAGALVDLAVQVKMEDGTVLADLPAAVGDRIVKFTTPSISGATKSPPVLIRVVNTGAQSGQGQYSLHVVKDDEAYTTDKCVLDRFDPTNDGQFRAAALPSESMVRTGLSSCGSDDYFSWKAPKTGTVDIHALYNDARVRVGMSVTRTTNGTAQMFEDSGYATNRTGGSFMAVKDEEYRIYIAQMPVGGDISNGPYFLHIVQP